MLITDLKCLKDFFGHQGPSSNFPCTLCRAPKEELNKIGVMRTFGEDEKNYSYTMEPLLPVNHFKVIPPTMHILHGLVNRALNILWDLTGAKEMGLGIIDKKADPHTHQFIGDAVISILDKRKELSELIADSGQKTQWLRLMVNLRLFSKQISAKELSDDGLNTLSYACEMVVKILHSFLGKTTPKAHWLLHCVIFAKEQRWLGLLSDQCLESLHSKLNLLMNRFKHTGDQMTALEGMLKHQLLWNFIHDEGLDEGQLLEEDQEEKENFSP
ncbi:unnamed protein product [Meloidogyne enterolobii]|uniref:Uncharacterized protein n=1 Tax=Meloidogyne enterolobii TaxID=390850 RepID=A0ACB0Y3B4_MELEN